MFESLKDILAWDAPESALQISPSELPAGHDDFGGVQLRGPSHDIVMVLLRHMRPKAGAMAPRLVLIAMLVTISLVLYHLFVAFVYVDHWQDIV
jgi:hypothetical protein